MIDAKENASRHHVLLWMRMEQAKASVRTKVEYPFHGVRNLFKHRSQMAFV
jgi:hypothetical protein